MFNSASGVADDSCELEWPPIYELIPGDKISIYVAFHGLMCLAYNREYGVLEAGVHSKAPHHRFRIDVFAFAGDLVTLIPVYCFEPGSYDIPGGEVTVEISEPIDPDVRFYLPRPEQELSWAEVLDLEGPEFYKRK